VYNCERFIAGCLEDLERQTIADKVEIIAVNTGSQENEREIIEKYQKQYDNIVYIEKPERLTIYAAWNIGIKAAKSKYITNANTDDRHREDAFEKMAAVLENNLEIDLVYPNYVLTEKENESFENHTPMRHIIPSDYSQQELLISCLPGPMPMWRRTLHNRYGYFNENLEVAGDWEFWLQISEGCRFQHINDYLGLYYANPKGAENRDLLHTSIETGAIGFYYHKKYFRPTHITSDTRRILRKQSEAAFYRADLYYGERLIKAARREVIRSLKYYPLNFRSYQLLCMYYIPDRMVYLLQKLKKAFMHFFLSKA